jgi:hypothetical protein
MICEGNAVERLYINIIAFQKSLLGSKKIAYSEVIEQHHNDGVLWRPVNVYRREQRVELSHAVIVATRVLVLMLRIALLMMVHIVGIDVVTHTNLRGTVMVMRHDRGNQHGDADNQH